MKVIIDPGHGMSNRRSGRYDSGAESNGIAEAYVVMDWANELRGILMAYGATVVRTRRDAKDPAPVGSRAGIARTYRGDIMISLHTNCADSAQANGTETFYRGAENKEMATLINRTVSEAMGTRNRGAKTEEESQHVRLAIMSFQPCYLIELGFLSNPSDRSKMLDPVVRRNACVALAGIVLS